MGIPTMAWFRWDRLSADFGLFRGERYYYGVKRDWSSCEEVQ